MLIHIELHEAGHGEAEAPRQKALKGHLLHFRNTHSHLGDAKSPEPQVPGWAVTSRGYSRTAHRPLPILLFLPVS